VERLIVDTDIGTYYDDAFAVLLAANSPEVQLEGVTTCYGDTSLRAEIACKVLEFIGRPEVPVFAGIGDPLGEAEALMFGFEGEGIFDDGRPEKKPEKESAVEFLVRMVRDNQGEITVCTLGTVTNVAAAIRQYSDFVRDLKHLIIMGGVIVPVVDEKGITRSPIEEYNLNNDPTAAKIVLESGANITLVPIDVTLRVPMTQAQIDAMQSGTSKSAQMVARILKPWPEQERLIYLSVGIPTEFTGIWLHDPLTIAVAYDPSLITTARIHVAAEYAPTLVPRDLLIRNDILRTIPRKKKPNMNVAVDVDADRFTQLFADRIVNGL
jgi:inosine-uridine nucleoside N-ribohydrolase